MALLWHVKPPTLAIDKEFGAPILKSGMNRRLTFKYLWGTVLQRAPVVLVKSIHEKP